MIPRVATHRTLTTALPVLLFACGRAELRRPDVHAHADVGTVEVVQDATTDAPQCAWQGFPAQHVGPGEGATLDTAVSTATSVLIGFEFLNGMDLANGIAAVDANGAVLRDFETLRPFRTPWRTAPVYIAASNDGRVAAVTSLGGCDYFVLDASGRATRPTVEFSDLFCSDVQPVPTGWTVFSGGPEPTTASFVTITNDGMPRFRSGESLYPGEARWDTPRAPFDDGSTLMGATRLMDRAIVVRHISPEGLVLSRQEIARTGRNFADALVAHEGGAFDVHLGSDTLVGSDARVRFVRLDREGVPVGAPTEIAGSDVLPESEFAATITMGELWIAYVPNRTDAMGISPIVVQRVSLEGAIVGDPFEVARAIRPRVRIAATSEGAILAYQAGAPSALFAVPILCR